MKKVSVSFFMMVRNKDFFSRPQWIGRYFFILVFLINAAFTQSETLPILKTKNGYTLIFNEEGQYFTLSFSTDSIQYLKDNMFLVDGNVFHLKTLKADQAYRNYLSPGEIRGNDFIDLTLGYAKSDINELSEKIYKSEITPEFQMLKLGGDRIWIVWMFDVPSVEGDTIGEPDEWRVKRQLFLSSLVNGSFLVINIPIVQTEKVDSIFSLAKEMAASLTVFPSTIDLEVFTEKSKALANNEPYLAHPKNCEVGINAPDWLGICKSEEPDFLLACFPEMDYFIPTLVMKCFSKNDFPSFDSLVFHFMKGNRPGKPLLSQPDAKWLSGELISENEKKQVIHYHATVELAGVTYLFRYWAWEFPQGYALVSFACIPELFPKFSSKWESLIENSK